MLTFEHDPNFGSRIGGESELDTKWLKLARELADDEPELQKERIDQLRKLLGEKEMIILPGEDWQMLMLLRAANSIPDEAAKVAKVFLEYRQKIFSRLPSQFEDLMVQEREHFMVSPYRDRFGRRVVYVKLWDLEKCSPDKFSSIFYSVVLILSREPKTQIAGISIVVDLKGLCYQHIPSWKSIKTYIDLFSGGCPVSFRDSHYFNASSLFKYFLKAATPFLPERIADEVHLHGEYGAKVFHDMINPEHVPKDFGGKSGQNTDGMEITNSILENSRFFLDIKNSTAAGSSSSSSEDEVNDNDSLGAKTTTGYSYSPMSFFFGSPKVASKAKS